MIETEKRMRKTRRERAMLCRIEVRKGRSRSGNKGRGRHEKAFDHREVPLVVNAAPSIGHAVRMKHFRALQILL
jgi:hypothetical protein